MDYDAAATERRVLERIETALDTPLSISDERRIFAQAMIQVIVSAMAETDDAARQNLLRYARGEVLDEIGKRSRVTRLPAEPAAAIFRFVLSISQAQNITIPKGTRVTSDGNILFATESDAVILQGTLHVDVRGVATTRTAAGNGYSVGSISALVDPLPFVAAVSNIVVTSGGSDIETDDSFRARIQQAPASFSVAGPSAAYEFFARSSTHGVLDVTATNGGPAVVLISVLVRNGYDPAYVLNAVSSAVSEDRMVRALTDRVVVQEAQPVDFDIDIVYYVPSITEDQAVEAIEGVGGAIDKYIEWQTNRIERHINPDQLLMMLVQAGALRVDISAPAHTLLSPGQVARLGEKHITHQVLEVDGR